MRLIDADALIKSHCLECDRYAFCNTIDECDNVAVIHASLAPTVDAVPVEWIEQYKQSIGSQTLMGYRWIEKMQKAWAERRDDETD